MSERRASIAVFLAACAVYANTLASGFVRDDIPLILENPLLKSWSSLPRLLATGYWEAAQGLHTHVQEFRPLTSLSFFLQYRLWGATAWPYHLANILLHAAAAWLLYHVLRRETSRRFALAAASAFALLPIHSEAVANIAGRPESLALLGMLGSWWFLGGYETSRARLAAGLLCFAGALFSKEHAALFPIAYAATDWMVWGRRPDDPARRQTHSWLWTALAIYLALRVVVLGNLFHGGVPYFDGVPFGTKCLTLSSFFVEHYLLPAITGMGLCADFSKSLASPASSGDLWALTTAIGMILATLWAVLDLLSRRSGWAFWWLLSVLFLLPTSHLLFPLDTLGAERFLYVPSLAWCAALGFVADRFSGRRTAALLLAALFLWYGWRTVERNRIWADEMTFYDACVRENPLAAGPRYSLGIVLSKAGRIQEAEAAFRHALVLGPDEPDPYYNLGRHAWERGDFENATGWFLQALKLNPGDADTLIFLGRIEEESVRPQQAEVWYRKAVAAKPWDPTAHYSLGRLLFRSRRLKDARPEFREFLKLAPDDPNAPVIRKLLRDNVE